VRSICVVAFTILTAALAWLPAAAQSPASAPGAQPGAAGAEYYSPSTQHNDLLPSALEVYSSRAALNSGTFKDLTSSPSTDRSEVLGRPSAMAMAFRSTPGGDAGEASSGGKRYLPVLFSALVPGAGELYLGYKWRGAALITVEIAAWTGYFYYRDKGLDTRQAYEDYADAYWNQDKWIDDHPAVYGLNLATPEQMDSVGQLWSGTGEWPGYMPWVSKEEDKQHFYENIGKYDWFISGWADWDPDYYDPDAEISFQTESALRDQYREMRKKSNDQLDTADAFIWASLGVRAFSIVETLILVRSSGGDSDGRSADELNNSLRLHTRARGFDGGQIYLQYSFK
jgi:hypothetical protein